MPFLVLVGALALSLLLIQLLELPFRLITAFSLPDWLYLAGAIALFSWVLDD
ncbi:MAG: hypothetical protein ACAF41_26710 [Leptolyngbya sp. BL-A-14]